MISPLSPIENLVKQGDVQQDIIYGVAGAIEQIESEEDREAAVVVLEAITKKLRTREGLEEVKQVFSNVNNKES